MIAKNSQIGPYTLIKRLGKGGCGEVWLADNPNDLLFSQVAVKFATSDAVDFEFIQNEATLWRKVSGHENVVDFIEAKIYDDQIVLVSEYADGGSLAEWLARNGGKAPNEKEATELILAVMSGLKHLHAKKIVHRDLKPQNILFRDGRPCLADFGISRFMNSTNQRSALVAGTAKYMAPETFDGDYSIKSDIWSVGVLFQLILTGNLPFESANEVALIKAIVMDEPKQLTANISAELRAIIATALQKEPGNRFVSIKEMERGFVSLVAQSSNQQSLVTKIANKKNPISKSNFVSKNNLGMEFVLIPAGEFNMGADVQQLLALSSELNWREIESSHPFLLRELPLHTVKIRIPFYLAKFPTTQKEWTCLMNYNPSFIKGDDLPVDGISWDEVQSFINELNKTDGEYIYRLPSEAEWEYACRAGTTTEFAFGNEVASHQANFNSKELYRKKTTSVGSFKPNAWGLYDMHGNVWEWCSDIFCDTYKDAPDDGSPITAVQDENIRVLRGGSWAVNMLSCRSAYRGRAKQDLKRNCNGFRLARQRKNEEP